MGLDISVYRNAKKVTDPEKVKAVMEHEEGPREGAYEHNYEFPYINPHFKSRAEGLEEVPYEAEGSGSFRAGSYSGYGLWRKELALLVGITDIEAFWKRCDELESSGRTPDAPFWQLLHFSDCEGAIGPDVCKPLAKDFADWEDRARKHAEEAHLKEYGDDSGVSFENVNSNGGWFWKKYLDWKNAFEQGSTGWVAFH